MKKNINTYILVLLIVLLVQACAVGPNFHEPENNTSASFRYSNNKTDSIINLNWWDIFNDPVLDTLILTALRENKNVLIAASRIEQARANVSFNKADFGPKFGVQAGASVSNQLLGIPLDNNFQSYSALGSVNWELDFWGKFRRSTESAKADLLASFYGKRALEIALISEVAFNYFQLLDFKARLLISENTWALRDSTLQIIQARFDEGYTNIIDVNQAQIQKAISQVSIPVFKRSIAFTEHNLSILLGKNPDTIVTLKTLREYALPDSIPTGIPSEILQRRPDILQSEQLYRSQNARIGIAQAQRFPSISLTGLLGVGSNDLSSLLSNGLGWSAGASLLGPIFEWGKNARRVDIEREIAKQSLLNYENTVLNALLEVDNSLISLSTLREELEANNFMLKAASNASYLSRERYYQGVTSYLEVIENQRVEFDANLAYSENYQRLLNAYVNLYKSLGGGWVTKEELNKYAMQRAEEENVDANTIVKDSLIYNGQIIDLHLTPEQEQARKEEKKTQRKLEKQERKNARNRN
ncbi:MAG: efflux transporter outer membrane subunit [Flavobacteriaceae bacterium]|nr:efflux transporter outer membrane subunit [Flavobacteriaceae bacterium]